MSLVAYMMLFAQDETNRSLYLGMLIGLLVALPSELDSLHFFGEKQDEIVALDKKLTEIYSPIHAMIVAVKRHLPTEPRQDLKEPWILTSVIPNYQQVSKIFVEHSHDLGNHNLEMWLRVDEANKATGKGFFVSKDTQAWFDALEAEYQRLVADLTKMKGTAR